MLSRSTFSETLRALGIRRGDIMHVQSNLRRVGPVEGARSAESFLTFYREGLLAAVGDAGTLSVHVPFLDYGRHATPFIVEQSASEAGVLSEHIRTLPDAVRSSHPIASIAQVGASAEEMCVPLHLDGVGHESPWRRLHDANAWIVALGLGVREGGTSFTHYIENAFGVPYLYNKIFTAPVFRGDEQIPGPFSLPVRYLDFGITWNTTPFKERMVEQGLATLLPLGHGQIFACRAQTMFNFGMRCLTENRYCFLANPPTFRRGEIPMDGPTGEFRRVYDNASAMIPAS